MKWLGLWAVAFIACTSTPSTTSTSASSGASSGTGGASSSGAAGASASSGQGGEKPLPDPDAGGMCIPNGGITQECDPSADAGKLCPPPCCDWNGCLCFRCRLQTDGVHRCQAFATDAGTCEL